MAFTGPEITCHLNNLFGPVDKVVDRKLWQVLKVWKYLHEDGVLSINTQREMQRQ